MATRFRVNRWRAARPTLLTVAALALLFPTAAGAQVAGAKPVDLPNGPAKPGFDITRFRNPGNGTFETFNVTKTEAMREVLEDGRVAEDTRLLVTETAAGKLALVLDQMAFHHAAAGRARNKDWFATF